MSFKILILQACTLGALSMPLLAGTTSGELDQTLIGQEWGENTNTHVLLDHCTYQKRFDLQRKQKQLQGLSTHSLICDGHYVIVFTVAEAGGGSRILDALTLPSLQRGESLLHPGECELGGNNDTDFYAVARFGRRESVNQKTGLRAAWVPDPEAGKIRPLSPRNVVCWRPVQP
jgi:hypothetical protein